MSSKASRGKRARKSSPVRQRPHKKLGANRADKASDEEPQELRLEDIFVGDVPVEDEVEVVKQELPQQPARRTYGRKKPAPCSARPRCALLFDRGRKTVLGE